MITKTQQEYINDAITALEDIVLMNNHDTRCNINESNTDIDSVCNAIVDIIAGAINDDSPNLYEDALELRKAVAIRLENIMRQRFFKEI